MSYKYSTGSIRRGDIYYEDDRLGAKTYIDFGQDVITLRPSGSQILHAQADAVGINTTSPDYTLHVAGDIGVDEYIRHNGDADTLIQFANDKIVLKAGNRALLTTEINSSQPHEVTINDGANNVDFVVKGNGSNAGNPLFKCDASTGRVGINGVGSPDCELHVAGDVKLHGDAPEITVRRDDNADASTIQFQGSGGVVGAYVKFLGDESGAGGTNNDLALGTGATVTERMRIRGDGKVGIGTTAPAELLHVSGNLQLTGDDPRIKIVADTDSHPGLEFYENSTRKWIIYNNYVNDNLTFKTNGDIRMSIKQGGNVGIGTQSPGSTFQTSGSVGFNVTSFTADASINITHHTCVVDCGPGGANGSVTLTLPTATNAISGRTYILKRADTGGSAPLSALMTVDRNSKPIDGATNNLTLGNGDCYTILCVNGTAGWIVVSHYVPI